MDESPVTKVSLVDRVKGILLKPKEEWAVIEREATPSGEIFTGYVMPLAAIGPLAGFLGGQLFGYGTFWFSFRPSLMGALSSGIVSYVSALVGVLVVTFLASKLAPSFGGESNQRGAFKLVAYSITAGCIAGAFQLIPSLGLLGLLGLYSLYLFYTGAGPMLKVPKDKALPFTVVTFVAMFVLAAVFSAVLGSVVAATSGAFGMFGGRPASESVSLNIPGGGGVTLDTSKVEQAAADMQKAIESSGSAVAPVSLQALLPAAVGAYSRTAIESMQASAAGSRAEGTYEAGDKSFKLSVADMTAVGAIAGLGAALNLQSNKEDADGYERTNTKDGNLVTEKWRKSGHGTYGTMVARRFFIEAEGEANSIDELKAAVASIDTAKLVALAK